MTMPRPLVLLASCLLMACTPRGIATTTTPQLPSMQLFLLAGQSNMAGRGRVEAQDRVPHDRVRMLDRQLAWMPAIDPVHFDKPVAGVGPGRSFGLAVADADSTAIIGLVPTAVGGSPITSWESGALDSATHTHPYDDALIRARAAMRSGTLKAILWHQGESDSREPAASLYEARLRALIERFRSDLGAPDLPFIIGQLGRFDKGPWSAAKERVDAAQRSVAAQMHNVAYVSSEGLTDRGDTTHFDAASARELGRRYAKAYATLRASGSTHPLDLSPRR